MKTAAKLAFYKGPATGWKNILGHWLVCVLDTIQKTVSHGYPVIVRYSHVELVIDGVCFSASFRDGGVRSKWIPDLETSGHFDVYDIEIDRDLALARFAQDKGKPYDWVGMLRCCPLLRWLPRRDGARFCSEEVAWMLGADDPERITPEGVVERYTDLMPS